MQALDFLHGAHRYVGVPMAHVAKELVVTRKSGEFRDWGPHTYWDEFEYWKSKEKNASIKALRGNVVQQLFTGLSPDSKAGKDTPWFEIKSFEVLLEKGAYKSKEKNLKIGSLNYQQLLEQDLLELPIAPKMLQSFWVPVLINGSDCSFSRWESGVLLRPIVFVPDEVQLDEMRSDFLHYKELVESGDEQALSQRKNLKFTSVLSINTSGSSGQKQAFIAKDGVTREWKTRSWYFHPDLKEAQLDSSFKL